VVGIAGYT